MDCSPANKSLFTNLFPGRRHNSSHGVVRYVESRAVPGGQAPYWAGWERRCPWAWQRAEMVWWTSEDVFNREQNKLRKDMKIMLHSKEFAL